MKVDIYSRAAIEELLSSDFPGDTAVISFYDPPTRGLKVNNPPVDYKDRAQGVFYVQIHDIDIEVLDKYGLSYDTYMPEAPRLASFIYQARENGLDIICQCEYGQSRSAACAAAILEHFDKKGISIFADYRYYPNQLVFNKLLEALEQHRKDLEDHPLSFY